MGPDVASTASLSSTTCTTSYPPWAWLAFDPLEDSFWVAAPTDCVAVMNHTSGVIYSMVAEYPVGLDPFGVAVDTATGDVFVTNTGSNNVTVLNGSTGANLANIPVGSSPYGVAYDPATNDVYVANGGSDSLSVISGSTLSVVGSVGVGTDPIGIAVESSHGQLFVANNGSNNLSVVATSNLTVVATVPVGQNPYGVAVDNETDQVYVTNRGSANVSVIDAWNDSLAVTIGTGLGMNPEGVAYNPVDQLVWVGAVFYTVLINTSTQTVLGYLATDPSGVAVNPNSGVVCVTNTSNATMRCIEYPNPIFPGSLLQFHETGLPPTINWSVTLFWPGNYHSTQWNYSPGPQDTVYFYVFSGPPSNYTYFIPPTGGYYPIEPTATISVSSNTVVNVTFVSTSDTYPVDFNESGLPIGMTWSVSLAGVSNQSTTTSIGFREPNGTYGFSVRSVGGYSATPSLGSILIGGAGVRVSVGFAPTPPSPANLTVTFAESGLPQGTRWQVSVDSTVLTTWGPTIAFSLMPGFHGYQLYPLSQFLPASPAVGYFELSHSNLTIPVTYVPVYTLLFDESGLPSATLWMISVDSNSEWSRTNQIRVDLPAGTHTFVVGGLSGYTASPNAGILSLNRNTTVDIAFSSSATRVPEYSVVFHEVGLPPLVPWCVVVNGSDFCSDSPSVTAELPNGSSYGFVVRSVPGYSAQPSAGTFSVVGRNVTTEVAFSSVPATSPSPELSSPAVFVPLAIGVAAGAAVGLVVALLWFVRRGRKP